MKNSEKYKLRKDNLYHISINDISDAINTMKDKGCNPNWLVLPFISSNSTFDFIIHVYLKCNTVYDLKMSEYQKIKRNGYNTEEMTKEEFEKVLLAIRI